MAIINNIESPEGNNSETSIKKLYADKEYYYNSIINYVSIFNDKVFFNDTYNQSFLYGIVDDELDVITPKKEFITRVESGNGNKQYLLDFAVDAFSGLKEYLRTGVRLGKMTNDGPYSDIRVHRSYVDDLVMSDSALSVAADDFKILMSSRTDLNYKVKDHQTFNKEYIYFLKNKIITKNVSVTKTGLTLSNMFLSFNNGLTFDIASSNNCDVDKNKYENWLNHIDFEPFKESCKRFGFLIDVNLPWRLTVDITSPAMQKTGDHEGYLFKKDITDIKNVFSKRYNKVYLIELEHMKRYFYLSYNYFMKDNRFYEKDHNLMCGESGKNRKLYTREILNEKQYLSKFDDSYWLRLYIYFRNYENISGFNQQKFENIYRESNNYLKAGLKAEALKHCNSYFKDYATIDYISNLQSISKGARLLSANNNPEIIF